MSDHCKWISSTFNTSVLDFKHPQASTIFYSSIFSAIIFFVIIGFLKRARSHALGTGDKSAAMAIILPLYRPILYAGIVLYLWRAGLVIFSGMLCNSASITDNPENMQKNIWNTIIYASLMFGNEWFANGFIFLFCKRSVSFRAFVYAFTRGCLLSLFTTALYVFGLNYALFSQNSVAHWNIYNGFQLFALLVPLVFLLIPIHYYRIYRVSASPYVYYSMSWRVVYAVLIFLSWIHGYIGASNDRSFAHPFIPPIVVTGLLCMRDILFPLVIYLVLLRDTHYWRGMPQRRVLDSARGENHSLTESLLHPPPLIQGRSLSLPMTRENVSEWLAQPRYPPCDEASNHLQNMLDGVPPQVYIDFAFLEVFWDKLLGRGATASVFVGMLTLKNPPTIPRARRSSAMSVKLQSPNLMSRHRSKSDDFLIRQNASTGEDEDLDRMGLRPVASLVNDADLGLDVDGVKRKPSPTKQKYRKMDGYMASFINKVLTPHNDGCESPFHVENSFENLAIMDYANMGDNESGLFNPNTTQVPVAIKMYTPPELDIVTIEAYSKETEMLTSLSHPNFVPYHGICVYPPYLCLVFSLCRGGSLEYYLEHSTKWSMHRRLAVACDCARSIQYLHSMGYVHRDIKPANFLLDEHGKCMLSDFATCLRIPPGQAYVVTDSIVGTVDHMAPEVLSQTRRNMFYGMSCDVFSLGIVIISVLSMKLPYTELAGSFQVRENVLRGFRPPMPECSPALLQALTMATSEQAAERCTAAQLLSVLESELLDY